MTDLQILFQTKQRLGIDRLALQIHDASFPVDPEEDCGRGSPYTRGADRFFAFAKSLGFDTIQLGPLGKTQRDDPSPYNATLFSRNPLNLPLARLVDEGRLARSTLNALRLARPADPSEQRPYAVIFDGYQRALAEIAVRADATDRHAARRFLAEHQDWVVPDALYEALCAEHNALWWGSWHRTPQGAFDQRLFHPDAGDEAAARRHGALRVQYAALIEDYALIQWLLEREHQALRKRLAALPLALFGDLQVGLSPQDTWRRQSLFLHAYRMGAPPSRTNPAGQPWGYAVFDPDRFGTLEAPGPVLQFVNARLSKVLKECDGLRIDHPHGWIDPWVYRSDDPDPFHAVQHGARLFSSPSEPDHPLLQNMALARPEQIDVSQPRHGDQRVRMLDETQVHRYAQLVDTIIDLAQARGRSPETIACEVLSTLPYPIQRVLEGHGLGRFRVTQKAKVDDPKDVYRIDNARPADWIMLGTHDTPTIWELAQHWCQTADGACWGEYLASFSAVDSTRRAELARRIAASPGNLINTLFTAMLASQARHVSVFFPDVFGLTERYNRPGEITEDNWRLRLSADFEQQYTRRCQINEALDICRCLREACAASLDRRHASPCHAAETSGSVG